MNKICTDEFRLNTISFDRYKIPAYITNFHNPLSASEEMRWECEIDPRLFAKMSGVDLSRFSDVTSCTLELCSPYDVQIRRHKKKRINKKWAKRYGYKTMFRSVKMVDCRNIREESGIDDFGWSGRIERLY